MITKKIFIIVMITILIVINLVPAYSGSKGRTGTAGATELLIPVGSRGTALGSSINAISSGVDAIFWNPAGLARTPGVETMFSHLTYIADVKLEYFAVSTNFGEVGTFGFSVRSLNFGDIPVTTVSLPEGTGEMFSPTYLTLGFTYSRAFTDRIYGGFTAKLVSEKIIRTSASGVAFDFGVQYKSSETGLQLGVTLKNIGSGLSFDGPDLERFVTVPGQEPGSRQRPLSVVAADFELPTTLEIGIAYPYTINESNTLTAMANFQNANFDADEYRFGLEYGFKDMFFLRGGYAASQYSDNIYGPTFGAGLNMDVGGVAVGFDYAYRVTKYFDANQWFSVKLKF
jgi:hypothetical protein